MPVRSLFPPVAIDETRQIAQTIAKKNAGQPTRRLDIFHELKRSPDSGPSRNLVSSSSGFGLTTGGFQADFLSLTELGRRLAVDEDKTALVDAVLNVDIFKKFFETYKDKGLPADIAAKSFLASSGIPTDRVEACWNLIRENGRQCGLIAEMAGDERVLSREHATEKMGGKPVKATEVLPRDEGSARGQEKPPEEVRLPSLNVNLEIHLPADVAPEVYDAIFSSMRKHLIDAGRVESP